MGAIGEMSYFLIQKLNEVMSKSVNGLEVGLHDYGQNDNHDYFDQC